MPLGLTGSPRTFRHTPAPFLEIIEVTDEHIVARFTDGRLVSVPLAWSWRLEGATPEERAGWELIADGVGVRWPSVDEDLSAQGFLTGTPAPRPSPERMRAILEEARAACRGQ